MQQVAKTLFPGAAFGGQQLCACGVFARNVEQSRAGAVMTASTINNVATPNFTLLGIAVSLRYSRLCVRRSDLNHTVLRHYPST
jgi:hypothetical protein